MERTRIRWRNVGRVAAAVGAGGLLIAVVPGIVEPPEPEPLPADVGLAPGATRAYASASRNNPRRDARRPDHGNRARDRADRRARKPPPTERRPTRTAPAQAADEDTEAQAEHPSPPAPAAPAPAPALVGPATGPVAATPPAPPASPPPPSPDPEPAAGEHSPSEPNPPPGPSQFGFEH